MRTIVRVGAGVGGVAFVALFALQLALGLSVTLGVVVAGLIAGLASAKWLERGWYGKQLNAGLRAGVVACGAAAAGALLSLLTNGPQSTEALLRRTHPARLAHAFAFAGWLGADLLSVLLAALAGVALAALSAQVFAWSKSKRTLQVIARARLTAQTLLRGDSWESAPLAGAATGALTYRATGAPAPSGLFGQPTGPSAIPPFTSVPSPAAQSYAQPAPPSTPASRPTWAPTPPASLATQAAAQASAASRGDFDAFGDVGAAAGSTRPSAPEPLPRPETPASRAESAAFAEQTPPTGEAIGERGRSSASRLANQPLSDAMRDALSTWASDSKAETPDERPTTESAYLNSVPPAQPKRNRKKQDTRDWLC